MYLYIIISSVKHCVLKPAAVSTYRKWKTESRNLLERRTFPFSTRTLVAFGQFRIYNIHVRTYRKKLHTENLKRMKRKQNHITYNIVCEYSTTDISLSFSPSFSA